MSSLYREAIQFFKQEQGFHRLLNAFVQKYRSLGRIGGTVSIKALSEEEKEAFSLFFREDFSQKNAANISMVKFDAALQRTKFAGLSLKELIEGYYGQPIRTKADEEQLYREQKSQFFTDLLQRFPSQFCQDWLTHITEGRAGTRGIHATYAKNRTVLKQQMTAVLSALSHLPVQEGYERLPLFASRVVGDPHALDLNTDTGKLLIHALQVLRLQAKEGSDVATQDTTPDTYVSNPSTEQMTELLQQFGIVRDDIQNFVTCAGLIGFKNDQREAPLPVWKAAYDERSVLNVPLRELAHVDRLLPGYASEAGAQSELVPVVFVVENSGVFSSLMDEFVGRNGSSVAVSNAVQSSVFPPLICTHGQFRLATLILLDKLVQNGTIIYYSGDFDPEGVGMAARLLKRHPQHVRLWRYSCHEYSRIESKIEIESPRLKKLRSVTHPELSSLVELMHKRKKAVYQEKIMNLLSADIRHFLTFSPQSFC